MGGLGSSYAHVTFSTLRSIEDKYSVRFTVPTLASFPISASFVNFRGTSDRSLPAANGYTQTALSSVRFVYMMARNFIGLRDSDFDDYVRSVLYDSGGEEFYEERRG
ncbi:hypothetical protein AVEN_46334-1 [Araneus ventricosus]|uniref:Uncharacterized protein n=1 Tax=Araneus ventricosus TaxID=182803 RepID=A0A4Y2WSK6_ARAVE|nr:hypothetical protein AVEN_46334-1 [Araneus ventricosus]